MSVYYRYSLDGTFLPEETIGWDTMTTTIKRDRSLKAILKSQDVTLQFQKTGYDYLYDKWYNQSFCTEVAIEIQRSFDKNTWTKFYEGIIFTKLIEFDEWQKIAKTKVDDNSYYAKIQNNKSQECLPFVALSRNEEDITAYVPPTIEIKYFNPSDCSFFTPTGKGYKLYDVFKFLIAFMTDAEVEFDSTLFGVGGEWENVMITYGLVVSQVNFGTLDQATYEKNYPKITFEKFLRELDHLFNLGFYVDNTGAKPKIWIENYDDLFGSNIIQTCGKVLNLKARTFVELLYSKLKIGGNTTMLQGKYPNGITFLGFKKEDYNIVGRCNVDNTLDLTMDYIVDTNVIEDCLNTNANSYDEQFILVNCLPISAGSYPAIQSNSLGSGTTPPCYYNEAFTNDKISLRYLKHIPNSIFQLLGNVDNKFRSTKTVSEVIPTVSTLIKEIAAVIFEDDFSPPNFDTFSNYDPATGQFTIAQGGIYSFYVSTFVSVKLDLTLVFPNGPLYLTLPFRITVYLDEYVAGDIPGTDVPINSYTIDDSYAYLFPTGQVNTRYPGGSVTVNSSATNFFVVRVRVESLYDFTLYPLATYNYSASVVYGNRSTYQCTNSITSGGNFTTYNPADYSVLLHEFDYPISETEFDNIDMNNRGKFEFGIYGDALRQGWIEQIKMYHQKGEASILLNASKNINND